MPHAMLDRFINFPLIIGTIAESFLFDDLLNCAFVNHIWNDAVSLVLYLDVITCHLHHSSVANSMRQTTPYFNTPKSLQALQKHARHISAIICKGADSLLALHGAGCFNLREVNYLSKMEDHEHICLA